MKILSLMLILGLMVSCGNDSSGGGSSKTRQAQEESSDNITADGLGIDLLDTTVDVPAKVSAQEITFLETESSVEEGRRISCKTSVTSGEAYPYSLSGNSLSLKTPEGTFSMERLTDGNDIIGSWSWKGMKNGHSMIKILSVVSEDRVILKTHCEL